MLESLHNSILWKYVIPLAGLSMVDNEQDYHGSCNQQNGGKWTWLSTNTKSVSTILWASSSLMSLITTSLEIRSHRQHSAFKGEVLWPIDKVQSDVTVGRKAQMGVGVCGGETWGGFLCHKLMKSKHNGWKMFKRNLPQSPWKQADRPNEWKWDFVVCVCAFLVYSY